MRIGYDAKRLFNNTTGLGNYSRSLVGSLSQLYPDDQYYLYTPKYSDKVNYPLAKNMVARSPAGLSKLFSSWWRTMRLGEVMKKDKLDVYHGLSHELPRDIEKAGIKSVVTIHDLIHLKYPEQYAAVDRSIYEAKLQFSCAAADKIVAISEQTKRDIMEHYKVPPEKIAVVYQSCDPVFMEKPTDERLKEVITKYNLPDKYLLYVGSLAERKNLLSLLKAFELLDNPNLHLLLVGNGTAYRNLMEKYIAEKQLTRVRILDKVPTADLPVIYRQAQAFVYPSLYEGFGIPIIEALWTGAPVITTAGGCFPEAGGPASLYIPTDDPAVIAEAIAAILADSELRLSMSVKGFQYVQQFRPEVVAERMMGVYKSLLHYEEG